MSIAVFIADDHGVIRDGIQLLLETQPDMKVIGQASNGREAVAGVLRLCPDIVLMDIVMPELNGIEAMQQILASQPSISFIILSMYNSGEHIFRALESGAHGYIEKESVGSMIIDAVRTVANGRYYFSSTIAKIISTHSSQVENLSDSNLLERLSHREREILQLVVEGNTSASIAQTLSLSPKTVETYRSRLMQKLDIHDLPGLVKFAIQHGLIGLE